MEVNEMVRLIYQRLEAWSKIAISNLPNLVVAILVILIFNLIARTARRVLVRILSHVNGNASLEGLLESIVVLVINVIGLFFALGVLGLDKTVTSLLAGAGVIALAVGFAFQDLTTNFISGTMIAIQRPIELGDTIETNGFTGRVISIKLRSVVLDNMQGQEIEIPSKDVFQKPIINYSRSGERRLEIVAGVSYLDDLNKAQEVVHKAINTLPFIRKDRPVQMLYRAFTGEMVQFMVWFWIDQTLTSAPLATSEAIKTIKDAFDTNKILILFPPHTFDLKKRLQEQPPNS
ncbi:mechanosensitive ion channel family protein [Nibrella saemangeumensis]